ncbi:hypothetical protein D9611_002923 [Ephemerocybe angulata]|uniref:Ndc10 domain-containing protein n=1 Tax=Ephemerocybe angulata TaxID=980116 RepID=A0A8H5C812_9AGAR|nr:hypothetical protein D9611_002923 [Tulosesus angulatus]
MEAINQRDVIAASQAPGLASLPVDRHSSLTLEPSQSGGAVIASKESFAAALSQITRKAPLAEECTRLGLRLPKSTNLARLKDALLTHWYPSPATDSESLTLASHPHTPPPPPVNQPRPESTPTTPQHVPFDESQIDPALRSLPQPPPSQERTPTPGAAGLGDLPPVRNPLSAEEVQEDLDEQNPHLINPELAEHETLVQALGIQERHAADTILNYNAGIDLDGDLESDEELDDGDSDGEEEDDDSRVSDLEAFKKKTRLDAARRAEGNRRPGGLRTQKGLVKFWQEFIQGALNKGQVSDDIVDSHSLLLFIDWCATRLKRTPKGFEIPNTLVGASQIKKHFFSVLRIRKEQEAHNPRLREERPTTSVHVWDAVKCRMDEAIKRVRSGDVGPEEDAPDIHRELRCVINGHLAWTMQNATGNRGDDIRALKIAELQPYDMPHPNSITSMFCILAMQGEEKAGLKGMQSKVNQVYSALLAHRKAEWCPIAALAFYHHYLYDVRQVIEEMNIDWLWNKSWRRIRLLHGKHPESPLSEQSLYNLFVRAYDKAGIKNHLKQHFARHLLPYLQAQLGVSSDETSRMGWKRGSAYFDSYAPALPKAGILAAHGYKVFEHYNPLHTNVHVPKQFLEMVCPMAEGILESIRGRENLQGTMNYWEMVIASRPYLFQSAAAIFKMCPESALFKLPALAHPDVQNWMRTTFQEELLMSQVQAGEPIALQRVEGALVNMDIQQLRTTVASQTVEVIKLRQMIERRTQHFSPTKGFSAQLYENRVSSLSYPSKSYSRTPSTPPPSQPLAVLSDAGEPTGVYATPDAGLRAFVNDSPKKNPDARQCTQVDLVLPPTSAFQQPGGAHLLFPPILGCQGATWTDIFKLVKQPQYLWDVYQPSKSLDAYETVENICSLFTSGEAVLDSKGVRSGMKPPLQLLEDRFGSEWRKSGGQSARKKWQRFREIPDWVVAQSRERGVTPQVVIEELEATRVEKKVGLNGLHKIVEGRRKEAAKARPAEVHASESASSTPELEEVGNGKRRAKAIDPRKRSKRK